MKGDGSRVTAHGSRVTINPYLAVIINYTDMLSEKMAARLNEQIAMEAYASFFYLSMAGWFDYKSMKGCASFMYRQSEEEHMHMMKLFRYVLEMNSHAISPGIKSPVNEFADVKSVFEESLANEQRVTKSINDLVELAISESDHATYAFLQWYVTEQREEENLIRTILDKINMIGDGSQSLYFIDKELEEINKAQAPIAKVV
jgi:ferritin